VNVLSEVISYKQLTSSPGASQVRGLVLLDDSLYVVRKKCSQIDVLHPTTLASLKTLPLPAETDACCMAGCQSLKLLYITCFINRELLKVDVTGEIMSCTLLLAGLCLTRLVTQPTSVSGGWVIGLLLSFVCVSICLSAFSTR